MSEFKARRPIEDWNSQNGEYRLSQTHHVTGLRGIFNVKEVEANIDQSDLSVSPATSENPARVILRVSAKGATRDEASEAAYERLDQMRVGKKFGILAIHDQKPAAEFIANADIPQPDEEQTLVISSFDVVLPPRERDYTITTITGDVSTNFTQGKMKIFTNAGYIHTNGHAGMQQLEADAGTVSVTQPAGSAYIRTINGDVIIQQVREPSELKAKTIGGQILMRSTDVLDAHLQTTSGPIEAQVVNDELHVRAQTKGSIREPREFYTKDPQESVPKTIRGEVYHRSGGYLGDNPDTPNMLQLSSSTGSIEFKRDTSVIDTIPTKPYPPKDQS